MKRLISSVAVFLGLACAVVGADAADIGFKGIGGHLALSDTGGAGSAVAFGANADMGEFIPSLAFRPSVTYWSKTYYQEWKISQFRLNADVRYEFAVNSSVKPYAGGGLALVRTSWGGPVAYYSASGTGVSVNLLGGATLPLTDRLDGFGEVRVEGGGFNVSLGATVPIG